MVLERDDFVKVLEQVDYLRQDQANLTQQVQALQQQIEGYKGKAEALQHEIEALDDELEAERKKSAILQADRDRLAQDIERAEFWGEIKNYGLVFLGAVAIALAL